MKFESRIVSSGVVKASSLTANPDNWRIHSYEQQQALREVLDEVGWVQRVIVNRTTGHVVDGHLRVMLALERDEKVPVSYVELSPEEEKKVLATFDPIGSMAATDREKLAEIMDEITINSKELEEVISELIGDGSPVPLEPENSMLGDHFAVVVKFETEQEQMEFLEEMREQGLDVTTLRI